MWTYFKKRKRTSIENTMPFICLAFMYTSFFLCLFHSFGVCVFFSRYHRLCVLVTQLMLLCFNISAIALRFFFLTLFLSALRVFSVSIFFNSLLLPGSFSIYNRFIYTTSHSISLPDLHTFPIFVFAFYPFLIGILRF